MQFEEDEDIETNEHFQTVEQISQYNSEIMDNIQTEHTSEVTERTVTVIEGEDLEFETIEGSVDDDQETLRSVITGFLSSTDDRENTVSNTTGANQYKSSESESSQSILTATTETITTRSQHITEYDIEYSQSTKSAENRELADSDKRSELDVIIRGRDENLRDVVTSILMQRDNETFIHQQADTMSKEIIDKAIHDVTLLTPKDELDNMDELIVELGLATQKETSAFRTLLENLTLSEGSDAYFTCETMEPDTDVEWYISGIEIETSKKYEIQVEDTIHTLIIKDITADDSGEVTAKCGNQTSTAYLYVEGRTPYRKSRNVLYFKL
ncbi:unnamed protein product [Owenia fusiformis]|uniref:Ig-like domain-containing protein n=1 Tax=Owenia fusiformis TaxID=6347 RepID=A0A8S4Q9E1_OWEFU|nr:unnamed protein product [Owenia fusiformis]